MNRKEKATKVTDEFCSNSEYGEQSKVDESEDNYNYYIDYQDPGNKLEKEDVFNHIWESLEQMFIVFKIKSENQQYPLDVFEKVKDTFEL